MMTIQKFIGQLLVGAGIVVLAMSWIQAQQFLMGNASGARHEVIEYGLPFPWIIWDSATGWRWSLIQLVSSFGAVVLALAIVQCVRVRWRT